MCYTVIIERGPNNFSADAPDFPGCVAAAETEEETIKLMREVLRGVDRGVLIAQGLAPA